VSTLPPPAELLELGDGESRELRVESFEVGDMTITPRDGRGPKSIVVVRVHLPREDKPLFPHYFDLTAGTLTPQVIAILEARRSFPARLVLTKYGVAPRARFTVQVLPDAQP